jgi:putative GTP pyrophosphokinase
VVTKSIYLYILFDSPDFMLKNSDSDKNPVDGEGPILSVRAFLEDDCGNVLLLKRADSQNSPGHWSLPGGTLKYTESPEQGLERLVKAKTGLEICNLDFLNYQNSPPEIPGTMHCLNMYFKASTKGTVSIADGFSEYGWVAAKELDNYRLAFRGNDAIRFYESSKSSSEEQLWSLVNEAGLMSIPVTRQRLTELQALPGFFTQLKNDLRIYEQVRLKVNATLEMIQSTHKRGHESTIVQIQSRSKKPSSVMEKMIRKGQDGIPRHYTTFDDMAGARAVVSFLKDVYTVRDNLLSFPEYTLRLEEDYIKDPKESGYRGLHLTLEVPLPEIDFVPRCEVQIKTVYQHSWSNASHELTYKNSDIQREYIEEFKKLSSKLWYAELITDKLRHDIEHLNDDK